MTSIDSARWLGGAMGPEIDRDVQWSTAELAAMLSHQLSAPIRADLEKVSAELAGRYDKTGAAEGETFQQLFTRAVPDVNVLQTVKDFSKSAIADKNGSLPEELGAVLYYAAISCAIVRCGGQRISGLNDETLKIGLTWATAQPWMDGSLRSLFQELLDRLK
jgi:hypothetical protein